MGVKVIPVSFQLKTLFSESKTWYNCNKIHSRTNHVIKHPLILTLYEMDIAANLSCITLLPIYSGWRYL